MTKKGKGSFLLRIYLSILVFLISFFTIYAFRNDIMDFMKKDDEIQVEILKEEIASINNKLKDIDADSDNLDEIRKIIKGQFKDYDFNIFTRGRSAKANFEENEDINDESYSIEIDEYESSQYFFSTDNHRITKQSAKYALEGVIKFRNISANLFLYPKFTQYLNIYRTCAFFLALFIAGIFYFLMRYENGHHKLKSRFKKINKHFIFKKLSVSLMIINIMAGILALSCFFFMYQNKYAFFDFTRELNINRFNHVALVSSLQEKLSEFTLTKANKKEVIEILNKHGGELYTIYIYDEKGIYYVGQDGFRINKLFYVGNAYDVNSVTSPDMSMYTMKFKNQTGSVSIYTYPLINLVIPYMVVIVLIAISLWLIALLCFIRRKVYEIKTMQEDVNILSTGDWNHNVSVFGNDEIAELGTDLNQMRISFLENINREEEARNANKELITSLSHDLRTPLTSLMGYLDIIHYDKCSEAQKKEYLGKSIHKVEQIRSLSDKMFEYFLIYGEEEKVELIPQSIEEWMEYVKECTLLLKQQGYTFEMVLCENDLWIDLNMSMMKRIMDNLYSNIQKYADKEAAIVIMSEVKENRFRFMMSNKKRVGSDDVESNHIGLKSVEKIVEMHRGEIFIQDEKENFMIILSFPLRNTMKH